MHKLTMLALKAAIKGGQEIMKVYGKDDFDVSYKSDNSPLTAADIGSHHAIDGVLKPTGLPILSEEGDILEYADRKDWHKFWLIDPLDGTKEFTKRTGEFTVNVALVEEGRAILGVVLAPSMNELFWGDEAGAYKTVLPKKWLIMSPMEVITDLDPVKLPSKKESALTAVVSVSHLNADTELYVNRLKAKHGHVKTVSVGSSLKLCALADGAAHIYPRLGPTMEWDVAAGHAVLDAAGGLVVDYSTKGPLLYNQDTLKNPNFLAVAKGLNADDYWFEIENEG